MMSCLPLDLIDYMVNNYSVDKQRIYACGLSNGGFMSYYLACNLPNKIAAIASVAGSNGTGKRRIM